MGPVGRLPDYACARARAELALSSLEKGYAQTAGEYLVRASLCAHYGQFLYFEYPETKRPAAELKARLFRKAAPLVSPHAQALEIPFDGIGLPAYLRLPVGAPPFPAVVMLGGVEAPGSWTTEGRLSRLGELNCLGGLRCPRPHVATRPDSPDDPALLAR